MGLTNSKNNVLCCAKKASKEPTMHEFQDLDAFKAASKTNYFMSEKASGGQLKTRNYSIVMRKSPGSQTETAGSYSKVGTGDTII